MAAVTYLNEATTEEYSLAAFNYILGFKDEINDVSSILGTSAAAIAGGMAEEHHGYVNNQWLNDALNNYGLSGIDTDELHRSFLGRWFGGFDSGVFQRDRGDV